MTEDRFDALILLQAHRDIIPDNESIIEHFINSSDVRRRLDLKLD